MFPVQTSKKKIPEDFLIEIMVYYLLSNSKQVSEGLEPLTSESRFPIIEILNIL